MRVSSVDKAFAWVVKRTHYDELAGAIYDPIEMDEQLESGC
jgi:hypothetical protein